MSRHLPQIDPFDGPWPDFDDALGERGLGQLTRAEVTTLQVNVGRLCNLACQHCHVDAGPKRTEVMTARTAKRVLQLLERSPAVHTLDLTGGAPELNPSFRTLVARGRALGRRVVDRCNLTVLFEPGQEDTPEFLAEHGVEIVASLPCYGPDNVDRQRGKGTFARSIQALQRLGALGYGQPGSELRLSLVYNPLGASLPPPQADLEADYRARLLADFGVRFHELLTITNMPIHRFARQLQRDGALAPYMELLAERFNPATVPALMCRGLVSVSWDGRLYDCDFNQMLDLPAGPAARTIWDIESLEALAGAAIATRAHCFGCTAGAGSSCGGALDERPA